MYSRDEATAGAAAGAGEGRGPADPLPIDDLRMDYDQIMHYFHNLKV